MSSIIKAEDRTIYTIGHSNKTFKNFIKLLKKYQIGMLVDVRSNPYSKFVPQFNHNELAQTLNDEGIEYRFLGSYLGGRPKDPSCYENGKVNYQEVAKRDFYLEGIDSLINISKEYITTILCSEENPARCHRKLLISKTLVRLGITIGHIYGDGAIEMESSDMIEKNGRVQYKLF